jgi:hypothetical protein
MGSMFELAKAREAIRTTRRRMHSVEERLRASSEPISFSTAKARRRLREAETAVKELKTLLDAGRGGRVNFELVAAIVVAEKRVTEARDALGEIDQ